jgi:hypothetical protein
MYNYIVIHIDKNNQNNISCDYICLRDALKLLNKYKLYIFKYKREEDMLYLEYPFNSFYSNRKINIIDNKEEDIVSFSYIEVRLTDIQPFARFATNMFEL